MRSGTAAAVTVAEVEVDAGVAGAVEAEITDLPAAAVVSEAEQGMVAVGAAMVVVLSTVREEHTVAVEEEEENGGKSDNRCWSDQILNPSHEFSFPASSNKYFPFHSSHPGFLRLVFLDSVRCSHDPLLALSRCSSAHWLFVLALSLLSCPFSNLACILSTSLFRLPFCLARTLPIRFVSARLFMIC